MGKNGRGPEWSLVKDTTDPDQIRHAEKRVAEREEDYAEDMRAVLAQKPGRSVLWRIISACGIYDGAALSTEVLSFREGERNVGRTILTWMAQADADAYAKMMLEAGQDARDREKAERPKPQENEDAGN